MEKTEDLAPIVEQKRFLENLIEGNLEIVRNLASLPEEERYKRAFAYFSENYEDLKDKEEKDFISRGTFYNYLDSNDLYTAWFLHNEPKELRDRVLYLCLRGLREGFLEFMELYRLIDSSDLTSGKITGFSYAKKHYDKKKKKMMTTKEKILDKEQEILVDTIEEAIKRRLAEDPIVRKYLAWNNSQDTFKANCENIALWVSAAYERNIFNKKLKRAGII